MGLRTHNIWFPEQRIFISPERQWTGSKRQTWETEDEEEGERNKEEWKRIFVPGLENKGLPLDR